MLTGERYRGAMLGLATGDALGAPVQFQPPGSFDPVKDMVGWAKGDILSDHFTPKPDSWNEQPLVAEIDEIAGGSFKHIQPPEIKGTGYVVKSLEAALWAFCTTDSFKDGCLAAVNLGDDADTTAAVYGQIAGACYGEQAIPASWLAKLAQRDLIQSFADSLLTLSRL